jgi:hypothetical protein
VCFWPLGRKHTDRLDETAMITAPELTHRRQLCIALPLRGVALAVHHVRLTRRGLQIALGLLWLLDGWGAGKVDIFAAVACAASKSPGGGECP